ncbi:GtrA family protein [Streptomyces sp. NPDC021224]|uniref:GtrA family protein n=1 Tax=unclassified Streptomyces TaxID=2593676 RepID=UPI0037A717D8
MSGINALRAQLALMYREIVKFGAVGGAGLLVNFGVYNLLRHLTGLQTVRASVLATLVSIVFNYVGFRYFTYRDRDREGRAREMALFLAFSCVGLVIENGILYVATYGFHWDSTLQSNIFKFLGVGLATLFRFWSYRTWVFRVAPAKRAMAETVEEAESLLAEGTEGGARSAR